MTFALTRRSLFGAAALLPLAAAAAVVGWQVRERGEHSTKANVTLGLSALSAVLLVVTIIGDAVAN